MSEYDHWNDPSVLPPVECPLVLKISNTKQENIIWFIFGPQFVKAERTEHIADKSREMVYKLDNGLTFTGRFPWTYP